MKRGQNTVCIGGPIDGRIVSGESPYIRGYKADFRVIRNIFSVAFKSITSDKSCNGQKRCAGISCEGVGQDE
jgi:hypothetical protein